MRRASRPRTPRGGEGSRRQVQHGAGRGRGEAGGVKGEVEKGLKAPDAAGAGKEVGGKYSTALGSSATPGTKGSVEKALKSADAEGAGKQVGGRFTGAMKSPLSAITGMIGPMLAVGAGVAIFKTLIDQGGAAVKATKVVEAAIKTTGGAAGVTGAQIEKMAGAQARATGVDKAAIQQSDALLLRYTNVKNAAGANNDVFNRTGQAALDMAAAMGKGTVTAEGLAGTTKILGKAMEDPAKAAGALRRAGVDLTAQQQAAIKTMLAHNDTLGAQKIVLDAVNKSYGGTAAATASGSAKMKVALQELEASLGKQLLPLFAALIKILTQVLDVFGVLVEKFTSNGRAMTIFRDIILGLVAVFAAYTAAVKINAAVTALSAEWTKVAAKATKLFKVETEGATIATRAQAAAQKILDAELLANPIGLIVVAIAALVIGLYELYKHSQAFRDIVHSAWSVVREIAVPAAHALGEAVHLLGEGLRATAALIGAVLAPAFRLISGIFGGARDALTGFIGEWTTSSNIFTGTFAATWNWVAHYAAIVGNLMFAPIRAAMTAFSGWWAGSGDQVKEVWGDLWKALSLVFRIYWDIITAEVRIGWAVIRALFEIGAAVVTAAWRVTWLLLGPVFKVAWDVVLTEIRIGWALIKAEFQIGMAVITAVWRIGWALLGAVLQTEFALHHSRIQDRLGCLRRDLHRRARPADRPVGQSLARHAERVPPGVERDDGVPADDLRRLARVLQLNPVRHHRAVAVGLVRHGRRREVLDRRDHRADPRAGGRRQGHPGGVPGGRRRGRVGPSAHGLRRRRPGRRHHLETGFDREGVQLHLRRGRPRREDPRPRAGGKVGKVAAGTGETADDVLIRVSRNETVVSAEDSRKPYMQEAFTSVPGPRVRGRRDRLQGRQQGHLGGQVGGGHDRLRRQPTPATPRSTRPSPPRPRRPARSATSPARSSTSRASSSTWARSRWPCSPAMRRASTPRSST